MKRLETTKRINNNVLLRVYRKGYGYAKLNIIEVNDYYIAAIADNEFINAVKPGDYLNVYLWFDNVASYEFKLKVLGKIEIENNILFLNHTEKIKRNSKRKCLAAEVSLPIRFFVFDTGEKSKSFSMEKVDFHKGTVIELGDRSAKIKCSEILSDEVFYKGHIKINGEDVELIGKFKPTGNENIYEITFSGMHERERNRLLDYVFSVYRE